MHYSLPLPCAWNVRKKLQNQIVNLIDNDFGIDFKLYLFATNIKRVVCDVLEYFFLKKKIIKKSHKMLCLMLDPEFKNLYLIFFIVYE
jgi:hypothetical protein